MSNFFADYPVNGSGSSGVSSLNGQTGALTLIAGSNITITPGVGTLTIASTGGGSGANTALSNLAAVAVNTSLLPGVDNSINLGSATKTFASGFIRSLKTSLGVESINPENFVLNDGNGAAWPSINFGNEEIFVMPKNPGLPRTLKWMDDTGLLGVGLRSPSSLAANYVYTFPSDFGTSGFFLQTDGLGGLTWAAGGSGGANTFLSNLTSPTAINQDLNLSTFNVQDVGYLGVGTATPDSVFTVGNQGPLYGGGVANEPIAVIGGIGPSNDPSRGLLSIVDQSPMAAGVGGDVTLVGAFTSGQSYTFFGQIKGYKTNSSSGNYSGGIRFYTHLFNVGTNLALQLDENSDATFSADVTLLSGGNLSVTQGDVTVVNGEVSATRTVTNLGATPGIFNASSDTTVSGSNTTIGINGVASGTVQTGAINDKVIGGMNFAVTRGDGTDQGNLSTMSGANVLLFHNPGASGTTDKAYGFSTTFFSQAGTLTDLYDFYSERVPAGPGVVTNHYGVYIKNDSTTPVKNWLSGITQMGGSSFSPAASTILDLQSTTGALLVPRMSTTDKTSLTATDGMIVYDTTLLELDGYINGAWTSLSGTGGGANTALSNLITTAINQNLIFTQPTQIYTQDSVVTNTDTMEVKSGNAGAGFNSGAAFFRSGDGDATGDAYFGSGVAAAGNSGTAHVISNTASGNSGDVSIATGIAGGTRGKIKLVDGSEGAAGAIWTSTDASGSGSWVGPGASGTFTTVDLKTVTVVNGIITSIV